MSEIKMNYGAMAKMKQSCQTAAEQLDNTMSDVNKILSLLEGGGLIGAGGTAYAGSLREILLPKIQKLRDKFEELQRDLQKAVDDMQGADTDSAKGMGI